MTLMGLDRCLRMCLATALMVAGMVKVLLPSSDWRGSGALFLAAYEVVLGCAMMLLVRSRWPIGVTMGSVALAIGYTMWSGQETCGCLGRLWSPTVGQRLVLLSFAGLAGAVLWHLHEDSVVGSASDGDVGAVMRDDRSC